jgi:hypothetical protein
MREYLEKIIQVGSNTRRFAAVISIEGIYIYSLSSNGLNHIIQMSQFDINNIPNKYEYPMTNREYDWSSYYQDRQLTNKPNIQTEITKYLNWFQAISDNYFEITFLPWDTITNSTTNSTFTIQYYHHHRIKP